MKFKHPAEVETVGIVGAGALGASWVRLALAQRLRVLVSDPAPAAASRIQKTACEVLGRAVSTAELRWVDDPAEVAAASDLVLEAGPEDLAAKQALFAAMDAAANSGVLLTSSTSGILPTSLQEACQGHPERVLVAHPFNPPHLMPLVEVVGGRATSTEAVDAAMALFRAWGKKPIRLRKELVGHVANRLQAALWREAYYLVETGAVSATEIDQAIAAGPGLRWALLGPFATQHLSGGPGGFAHVCKHLGPATAQWWEDLGAPSWTQGLVDALVASVDEEFLAVDVDAVRRARDAALIDLLRLKEEAGLAEGVGREAAFLEHIPNAERREDNDA